MLHLDIFREEKEINPIEYDDSIPKLSHDFRGKFAKGHPAYTTNKRKELLNLSAHLKQNHGIELVNKLLDMSKNPDKEYPPFIELDATKTLLSYAYGKPTTMIEMDVSVAHKPAERMTFAEIQKVKQEEYTQIASKIEESKKILEELSELKKLSEENNK